MKSHLIAFGGAAQDYSAGLVTVPFVSDPVIRATSNVLQLSEDCQVVGGFAGGIGHTRLRLNSANSRIRGYPNLIPFAASHLPGDNPPVMDFRDTPINLYAGENVSLQATNAGAQAFACVLNLVMGGLNQNINTRGTRWVRFTASVTSIAYSWSNEGNVVLDDDLEAGNYNVFGLHVFEADAIAARLVFKDQVERPGVVCGQAATDRMNKLSNGGLGLLGTFNSITPPFIQAMHVAAAAQSLVGWMLVGKA